MVHCKQTRDARSTKSFAWEETNFLPVDSFALQIHAVSKAFSELGNLERVLNSLTVALAHGDAIIPSPLHSRSQRPRSFWSAPGIETSGRSQFLSMRKELVLCFSANQICHI